jgi:hypothetical protein
MAYTLGDAARATGKSKPTIAKAIKAGRISATKTEDGSYQIDPSELHRVYPMASEGRGNSLQNDTPVALAAVTGELELLRSQAAEYRETIRDLRARLDREAEERRQLIAILTDQRRRPWWRRWFR